jgi:hypothetical protein
MKVSMWETEDYNPPELVAAVERGFRAAGIKAEVVADRRLPEIEGDGANGGPHLVELFFGSPLRTFATTFFGAAGAAAGKAAGEDAWRGFKRLLTVIFDQVKELWPPPPGLPEGEPTGAAVILEDNEGLHVLIPDVYTDEALQALADVPWDSLGEGVLTWNTQRREWEHHPPPRVVRLLDRLLFWRRNR